MTLLRGHLNRRSKMSFASQTWTIDTASSPWVYSDGSKTTVSGTGETATFTGADTGAGGTYAGRGTTTIALADGNKLYIDGDYRFTNFRSESDGATTKNGSIWAKINGGRWEEINIVSMTVTDGDAVGANNLAAITFEYPGKPYRWSWANINTA